MEAALRETLRALCVPGQSLVAVPGPARPRLFIPAETAWGRWRSSRLYPASRWTAKAYRLFLRIRTAACGASPVVMNVQASPLADFLVGTPLSARATSILVGTPGPAQKFTVGLWDEAGEAVGYLKYGETDRAVSRIRNESEVLTELPDGLGPRLLKYGPLGNGVALLATPVQGRHLPASLPPDQPVLPFLKLLPQTAPPVSVDDHPWTNAAAGGVAAEATFLRRGLDVLSRRTWRIVYQHGDFAPWNLLRGRDGTLRAVDWEYGSPSGFPWADLAYYILQVGMLMGRWKPDRTLRWAVRYLSSSSSFAPAEVEAIIRLTAWHAYQQGLEDQHPPDSPIQSWRRTLWNTA